MDGFEKVEALPVLITVQELSEFLHIKKSKAYELARSEQLRCIRIGRQIRILRDSLDDYIHSA